MKTVRLGGYTWRVLDTDADGVMTLRRSILGRVSETVLTTRAKLNECDDEGAVTV